MDLLSRIGSTPLLRLARTSARLPHVTLLGKAEFTNPGGSVKDRPARGMILAGLESGRLTKGKTILEATSGNTGIADAMIGAALGFPVMLCLPSNASAFVKDCLRAYGATLELTSPLEGTDGAARRARELAGNEPERFFYPDQYANEANWKAHFTTTGPEIWAATEGAVTHFVAGTGTSGTLVGTSRYLRSRNPDVFCAWVQPDGPIHGIEGTKHYESTEVPAIFDETLPSEKLEIETDEAHAMTRRLAAEEGLLVGVSSGANVAGALRLAESLPTDRPAVIVTMLCDGGGRYLVEPFWRR